DQRDADGPARRAVHHHRPRRHRRPGPRRGHRVLRAGLRRALRARGDERGAGRPRGDAGRRERRHPHPAARAADAGVDDRQVHRPVRSRPAAAGVQGRGRRGGQRHPPRARPAPAVRRPQARDLGQPGELHPSEGRRRRPGRAGAARRPHPAM
ncbi:MAG: Methylmalonyl-CoA epimerase @ Ethylmalonyl-CoA epimerase, partial [uncultured Blastococcus sp.]